MNNITFRDLAPIRSYNGPEKKNYREYKSYLREDFNHRCGYTHCSDHWFGGSNNFHIDHFKSVHHNPELKTIYSNLVYCCSYVNIAKSKSTTEYLDPCEFDYNEYFFRNSKGDILPKNHSPIAKLMHTEMKLYLRRYSIIWMLEQLELKIPVLQNLVKDSGDIDAINLLNEVIYEYFDYLKYLRANL